MNMRDPLNHLGSIWHHSEPNDREFFCNLQQGGSSKELRYFYSKLTTEKQHLVFKNDKINSTSLENIKH